MLRHRSLTDEPVLAFGGAMPLAEGEQRDLHKSASDPTHIIHGLHGMGSLTWVSGFTHLLYLSPPAVLISVCAPCIDNSASKSEPWLSGCTRADHCRMMSSDVC